MQSSECTNPESLGFYSCAFLISKKNRKLCTVFNLRWLNCCLLCPHFQMETVASITVPVQPGNWATSLDLTDVYFHVPVALWFWKYLRFVVNGWIWQFQALPFVLSTAPLVCTHLLAPLSIWLHAHNILFYHYLDNLLIRALTQSLCQSWTQMVLSLLYSKGLGVNHEKLEVVSSQDYLYMGVHFQTLKGISLPPPDCLQSPFQIIHTLLDCLSSPAQVWLSLLGAWGLWRSQSLWVVSTFHLIHFCLQCQLALGLHTLSRLASLSEMADLPSAGGYSLGMWRWVPLDPFHPHLTFTDSSLDSWGAHSMNLTGQFQDLTQLIYESKWLKFALWCAWQDLDPEQATVSQICKFFLLFEHEQLSPSFIDGYRSTINSVWGAAGQVLVGLSMWLICSNPSKWIIHASLLPFLDGTWTLCSGCWCAHHSTWRTSHPFCILAK